MSFRQSEPMGWGPLQANEELSLGDATYRVCAGSRLGMPVSFSGKEGTVYKVSRTDDGTTLAMKVFKKAPAPDPRRDQFLLELSEQPSFSAARRESIVHPRFALGAVLMPWIQGAPVSEILLHASQGTRQIRAGIERRLAIGLLEAMVQLEDRGWVHGDLSSQNVFYDLASSAVEIIDLDRLLEVGRARPSDVVGTFTYKLSDIRLDDVAHADREALALLVAETLALTRPSLARLSAPEGMPDAVRTQLVEHLERAFPRFARCFQNALSASRSGARPTAAQMLHALTRDRPSTIVRSTGPSLRSKARRGPRDRLAKLARQTRSSEQPTVSRTPQPYLTPRPAPAPPPTVTTPPSRIATRPTRTPPPPPPRSSPAGAPTPRFITPATLAPSSPPPRRTQDSHPVSNVALATVTTVSTGGVFVLIWGLVQVCSS